MCRYSAPCRNASSAMAANRPCSRVSCSGPCGSSVTATAAKSSRIWMRPLATGWSNTVISTASKVSIGAKATWEFSGSSTVPFNSAVGAMSSTRSATGARPRGAWSLAAAAAAAASAQSRVRRTPALAAALLASSSVPGPGQPATYSWLSGSCPAPAPRTNPESTGPALRSCRSAHAGTHPMAGSSWWSGMGFVPNVQHRSAVSGAAGQGLFCQRIRSARGPPAGPEGLGPGLAAADGLRQVREGHPCREQLVQGLLDAFCRSPIGVVAVADDHVPRPRPSHLPGNDCGGKGRAAVAIDAEAHRLHAQRTQDVRGDVVQVGGARAEVLGTLAGDVCQGLVVWHDLVVNLPRVPCARNAVGRVAVGGQRLVGRSVVGD